VLEGEVLALRAAGFDKIVVDLRQVEFIDSTGLRVLMSLRNGATHEGYSLVLIPARAPVQRIFELTGTRGRFDWRDY
jgi:anti-anti-sigma factor